MNLGKQMIPLLLVSLGQSFTVLNAGLDLSVSSTVSAAGVVGVLAMPIVGVPVGIGIIVLMGGIIGLINGYLIGYIKLSPLIVTLGMMSIASGFALLFAGGVPIYEVPESLVTIIGYGATLKIPNMVWIGIFATVIIGFVLHKSMFGRYVFAVGSNENAAYLAGVNVPKIRLLVYTVCGLMAGIASVVIVAWIGAAQPNAVPTLTLESLAAVVLGGVALTGGRGNLLQVLYGVFILAILNNAMTMLGISSFYQIIAVGVVIISAVVVDKFRVTAIR